MIAFDRVEKRYDDGTIALAGVSFEIPNGQFCVLLGPSGAGKSTLLRTLNGLSSATAGEIRIGGVRVAPETLPGLRPAIGMIHQQFNLTPRASAAFNVIAGALPAVPTLAALLGWFPAQHRSKACELMAAVGLGPEHLCRRVDELSGGQQQRIGIARAFMLDPALVLADEPVASLDPATTRDVLQLLKEQALARNATVLCSLHQIDLALAFADRIVALRTGRLIFDGAPAELTASQIAAIYGHPTAVADTSPAAADAGTATLALPFA